MKEIVIVVAGVIFLSFSAVSADAAPARESTGLQNSKKVVQANTERYKKADEVKKRARAQKEAQRQQNNAPTSGN